MTVTESDVVIVDWDDDIFNRADERAGKKAEWIDTWKNRTKEQRKADFLDGQLGEEGLRRFFEDNDIDYEYYDDVRTDDFKEKDKFDFMVTNTKGRKIEVSVKSSKLKKSIQRTVDENNILAYPGQVKPITVQPFIDYDEDRIILSGWAAGDELKAKEPQPLPGSFSDRPVSYHRMTISECSPMSDLKNHIENL